ncbi:MAG: hypothetical protein JSS98_09195 [Bacteroidetes bacterium]|nr:hypothetical protein [Bacteroidota bacterium]
MFKLRTLLVIFDSPISRSMVSSFRGAVIARVGLENKMFHNHDEDKLVYKYPLIQYKVINKKASLYCIGNGVDEIHNFFGLGNWDIQLQDQKVKLKIDRLDLNTITLNVWEKSFQYTLYDWLALNAENYKKYQAIAGLAEKIQLLERLLTGNILSFAKGIGWHIEKPIKVQIEKISGEKMIKYKGVPLMAFDVAFSSNVFLPNYLGLGKSASHGFGVVRMKRDKENKTEM